MQTGDAIAVSVLTGFLGSGKTTLLNRLLRDPALRDTAVIINEFGDVAIDHLLVETSGDGVIELSDGCLCCTIRGELVDTLTDLIDRQRAGAIRPLKRIVIETTGLADPAPVLQAVMAHPLLSPALRLDGVVTTVDAVNGMATLDNHDEAVKQVAVADRIVITKADLAGEKALAGLSRRLGRLNPGAPRLRAFPGEVETGSPSGNADRQRVGPFERFEEKRKRSSASDGQATMAALFNCGLYDPATKSLDVQRWLRDEGHGDHFDDDHSGHEGHRHGHDVNRHDARIRAVTLTHDRPVDPSALEMFLDLVRSAHGERLLRLKGIVALSDDVTRPVVIHGVQSIFHEPARLAAWPCPDDRRTRIVVITRDLDAGYLSDLFDAFTGKPAIDRPDRDALKDNPLAVAGYRFRP